MTAIRRYAHARLLTGAILSIWFLTFTMVCCQPILPTISDDGAMTMQSAHAQMDMADCDQSTMPSEGSCDQDDSLIANTLTTLVQPAAVTTLVIWDLISPNVAVVSYLRDRFLRILTPDLRLLSCVFLN